MEKELDRYDRAAAYLPGRLRLAALAVPKAQRRRAREFRLRAGQALTVLLPEGELALEAVVEPGDLELLCDLATEYSRYAATETIREGYLPVRGGFRIGLCGTAVMKGGQVTNLRDLSSAAIRISRELPGIAAETAGQLFRDGSFCSTLICSPPGGGKTTFLRDLVRILSDGTPELPPRRIALIDERNELAVCHQGEPQLEVGSHTDVLDSCPKALAIPMVLRAMNPEIIAVDEVTAPEDIAAMKNACGCGVGLLATIHADSPEELTEKPLHRQLLEAGVFQLAVEIRQEGDRHLYIVKELPCASSPAVP